MSKQIAEINVSSLSLRKVAKYYYKSRTDLVQNHSRYISGRTPWPADTCALRVSLALSLAGVRLPFAKAWLHVHGRKRLILPASAGEFYKRPILQGARKLKTVMECKNEKGILYMSSPTPAHITLWDHGAIDKTMYCFYAKVLYFWKLA